MTKPALAIIVTAFLGLGAPAAAQVAADWTTPLSGSLDGVSIEMVFQVPAEASLSTADFTGTNFVLPLTTTTEVIGYAQGADWTATFAQPVDLLLYTPFLRTDSYTFDQTFTILSGFSDVTVTANTLLSDGVDRSGILQTSSP